MRCEPRHCRLRYTFYASPMGSESGYDIQNAFPAEYRYNRHCNRPDHPLAYIVANPERHVVISPFPLNAASFIPNLTQPLHAVTNFRSKRERPNSFNVRDTLESI